MSNPGVLPTDDLNPLLISEMLRKIPENNQVLVLGEQTASQNTPAHLHHYLTLTATIIPAIRMVLLRTRRTHIPSLSLGMTRTRTMIPRLAPFRNSPRLSNSCQRQLQQRPSVKRSSRVPGDFYASYPGKRDTSLIACLKSILEIGRLSRKSWKMNGSKRAKSATRKNQIP